MSQDNIKPMILKSIEDVLQNVRVAIERGHTPSIRLDTWRTLKFPGSCPADTRDFAIMVRLMGLVAEVLRSKGTVTKRDLYYRDVHLFKSQKRVEAALRRLCSWLHVECLDMGVCASPKGLFYGNMTVFCANDSIVYADAANRAVSFQQLTFEYLTQPISIPSDTQILMARIETNVSYILVVEKEVGPIQDSQSLLTQAVAQVLYKRLPNAIIITGKGYPDMATRRLLKAIEMCHPELPMYGVVDSDIYGFRIMATYKNGAERSKSMCIPRLQYLGVTILEYREGWVEIAASERYLARSLLRQAWMNDPEYHEWKQEIQRGLFMNLKAEMNLLAGASGQGMVDYIKRKLDACPYNPTGIIDKPT